MLGSMVQEALKKIREPIKITNTTPLTISPSYLFFGSGSFESKFGDEGKPDYDQNRPPRDEEFLSLCQSRFSPQNCQKKSKAANLNGKFFYHCQPEKDQRLTNANKKIFHLPPTIFQRATEFALTPNL